MSGGARLVFREHETLLGYHPVQLRMADGIRDVDTGAQNRYSAAAGLEYCMVHSGVYASSHSTHDSYSRSCEDGRNGACRAQAV